MCYRVNNTPANYCQLKAALRSLLGLELSRLNGLQSIPRTRIRNKVLPLTGLERGITSSWIGFLMCLYVRTNRIRSWSSNLYGIWRSYRTPPLSGSRSDTSPSSIRLLEPALKTPFGVRAIDPLATTATEANPALTKTGARIASIKSNINFEVRLMGCGNHDVNLLEKSTEN